MDAFYIDGGDYMVATIMTILLLVAMITDSAWLSVFVYTMTIVSITVDVMKYREAKRHEDIVEIKLVDKAGKEL